MPTVVTGTRVLFGGQYRPGANAVAVARAFEECGALIHWLDETTLFPAWAGKPGKGLRRLVRRLIIEAEWNHQICALARTHRPDLLFLASGFYCWPRTLDYMRSIQVPTLCFYFDPQWQQRPGSRFDECIAGFDLIATPRAWQVEAFQAAGARKVVQVRFGYNPDIHQPRLLTEEAVRRYGAQITLVASYDPYRTRDLEALVERQFGYHFRLWGDHWASLAANSRLRNFWQRQILHDHEVAVAYAASEAALHWLRWDPTSSDPALRQGDQHSCRTFQIAACGGALMIAQRTEEHRRLFTEDVEAVYFDDVAELRDRLNYWLEPAHVGERRAIAAAARRRCLEEDYTYVPVIRTFLDYFGLPCGAPGVLAPFQGT